MNKLLLTFVGTLALGATLPVLAGPDWQAIEQARQAKQASQPETHGDAQGAAGRPAAGLTCPSKRPTLLLDHGPRAQGTPYLNRLRQERYEAALKACQPVPQ